MIINSSNFDKYLNDYRDSLKKLLNLGINLNQDSRIIEYKKIFEAVSKSYLAADLQTLKNLGFIFKEIDEITKIVGSLDENLNNQTLQKLKHLKKDHLIQKQNKVNIEARNTQFELYLRYLILEAGMICKIHKPDLVVEIDNQTIEVEAKRPNSKGLDSNLRKGLSQLNKNKAGVLAFSLDHLIFGDNKVILLDENEKPADGLDFLDKTVNKWAEANKKSILRRINSKQTATGLIFYARVPIIHPNNMNFVTIGSFKKMVPLYKSADNEKTKITEIFFNKLNRTESNDT